jgi:predicted KAP-like P-loop ATPase
LVARPQPCFCDDEVYQKIPKKKTFVTIAAPKLFHILMKFCNTRNLYKKKQKQLNTLLFPSILTNYFDKKCQLSVAGVIHIQMEDEQEVHLQLYKRTMMCRLVSHLAKVLAKVLLFLWIGSK